MGSKKTVSVKQKQAPKKQAQKKTAPKTRKEKTAAENKPRHPKGRVAEGGRTKEALAKTLASALARGDENSDTIATRLKTASNRQLLRLEAAVATLKKDYGSRDKLVASIVGKQSKDKHYTAKLEQLSLPNLLELAKSGERRVKAAL